MPICFDFDMCVTCSIPEPAERGTILPTVHHSCESFLYAAALLSRIRENEDSKFVARFRVESYKRLLLVSVSPVIRILYDCFI